MRKLTASAIGDGNGSCIHLCQVRGRLKLRTISNIPGLMGIAVTDGGTVFLSSSKEHALFSLKEEEMLGGKETLTKVCGETAGHRDGVQSRWNKPTALCVYRNTVFVCDTALERTGKRNTNGPDMTIPASMHPTVLPHSARIADQPYQHANGDWAYMTTLGVECYFKGMRADHDMPTVANYAYRKARCVEDDMLRIYQKNFSYFTGPNSYYPEKIIKGERPNIKTRPNKLSAITEGTGSKEEDTRRETVMREFAKEYGRGDVQIEVNGGKFVQQRVSLKWLNQTSDSLTYTSGDVCNGNSPKCILTREDNRLCRIANGDYGDDDDNENETAPPTAEDEGEVSL
ncbi:unnamed protein product, partial [Porites lobata]